MPSQRRLPHIYPDDRSLDGVSFVIVANHVHLLLLPSISPSLFLKSLKGSTAREANRLLHRTGEQFWQRESYDHWRTPACRVHTRVNAFIRTPA
jgi:hypothetical protein